jgi:tetraacyldisaccharide 4'-kinase
MLKLLGKIYGLGAEVRNAMFDRGVIASHSLGAKTISVGNITMGGTGKTPLVAYVAEILADAGEKVCILTRGYARESGGRVLVSDGSEVLVDAATGGDEPVELARMLLGKAIVVVDADRVTAAEWAKEKFNVTAFVLDDGFQHRRAKRDLDIVCVDATNPFHFLREPLRNLDRANAIVVTRADLADSTSVIERLRETNSHAPVFRADYRLRNFASIHSITDAFAFCGIGNPAAFFSMLTREGLKTENSQTFGDHHSYSQADVDQIESMAIDRGCTSLITTAKDSVKLEDLRFSMPCLVAKIEVVIDDPDGFRDLVLSA